MPYSSHPTLLYQLAFITWSILGGADKSLDQPGRKQATATTLGICSTYSLRSSIHFLARCCNFCKSLKKIQKIVPPTRSPRQQCPACRTKNGDLSIVSSVQGTGTNSKALYYSLCSCEFLTLAYKLSAPSFVLLYFCVFLPSACGIFCFLPQYLNVQLQLHQPNYSSNSTLRPWLADNNKISYVGWKRIT